MTDTIAALTVVLKPGIREDDCKRIVDAIKLLEPVLDVQMNVADWMSYVNQAVAKAQLKEQIARLLE